MKNFLKTILIIFFLTSPNKLLSEVPHYLDFKYILNESVAGKKAQDSLKKKLKDGVAALNKKKKNFLKRKKIDTTKKINIC